VLTGSRQAQEDADAAEPEAGFRAAAKAADALWGRKVEGVEMEAVTHSLILRLEGGYEARRFVSDPTEELDWHIEERATRLSLEGCAAGLKLIQRPPRRNRAPDGA
jgi:hypothetical protein